MPSRKSLFNEAQNLLFAGSDSVGNTLAVGIFHILNNPEVYKKLVDELLENWPKLDEPLGYEEIERLPYLVCYNHSPPTRLHLTHNRLQLSRKAYG